MAVELAQDLLPLHVAAKTMYARVYSFERDADELADERLNRLATAIATAVPVYSYDPRRPGAITELDEGLLLQGRFRQGGRLLAFADGRAPVDYLAVTRTAVNEVRSLLDLKDELENVKRRGDDHRHE